MLYEVITDLGKVVFARRRSLDVLHQRDRPVNPVGQLLGGRFFRPVVRIHPLGGEKDEGASYNFV